MLTPPSSTYLSITLLMYPNSNTSSADPEIQRRYAEEQLQQSVENDQDAESSKKTSPTASIVTVEKCKAAVEWQQLSADANLPGQSTDEPSAPAQPMTVARNESNVSETVPKTLAQAISDGNIEMIRSLAAAGADVNEPDETGTTPLALALFKSRLDVFSVLLDLGADINQVDAQSSSLLHYAASHLHGDAVEFLVSKGANVDHTDSENMTPLHYAAMYGNTDVVRALLAAGAQMEIADAASGSTPLLYACQSRKAETIQVLIDHGADIAHQDNRGNTAFHYAVSAASIDVVKLLVNCGLDLSIPDEDGKTSFDLAIKLNLRQIVEFMLETAPDLLLARDESGRNALHQAAISNSGEMINTLLRYGANPHERDDDGATALHLAAGSMRGTDGISRLLTGGANVNDADDEGRTPLMVAASNVHADALETLLRWDPDTESLDIEGRSALILAVQRRLIMHVDKLLDAGANANAGVCELKDLPVNSDHFAVSADQTGRIAFNALDWAIALRQPKLVDLFLKSGAQPSANWRKDKMPSLLADLSLLRGAVQWTKQTADQDFEYALITLFDLCVSGLATDEDIKLALREAGLMTPLIDELFLQFKCINELVPAMASAGSVSRSQMRQAVNGMMALLRDWYLTRPLSFSPYLGQIVSEEQMDSDSQVDPVWEVDSDGDAYHDVEDGDPRSEIMSLSTSTRNSLTKAFTEQVQAIYLSGEQTEANLFESGISGLMSLCLQHLPAPGANAAALRTALTAGMGLYGILAERVVLAWQSVLEAQPAAVLARISDPDFGESEQGRALFAAFDGQLKTQLSGVTRLSQFENLGLSNEAAQLMTQLMMRQWERLQ